jgi:hypothetical protein
MTILILDTLKAKGACADQLRLFEEMFGQSVDVTRDLCVSVADKFNFTWAARELLTAPALADYERATATAWPDYERATATAWADYGRATATAWADYGRATATARADYGRAMATARADYGRARAAAFANAYNSQENAA